MQLQFVTAAGQCSCSPSLRPLASAADVSARDHPEHACFISQSIVVVFVRKMRGGGKIRTSSYIIIHHHPSSAIISSPPTHILMTQGNVRRVRVFSWGKVPGGREACKISSVLSQRSGVLPGIFPKNGKTFFSQYSGAGPLFWGPRSISY